MNRLTVSLLFLVSALAMNGHPARPFGVDDAGTVAQDHFEIETSTDFGRSATGIGLALKHGVTDRMDIGLSSGYDVLPALQRAATPLELSMKYAFIPGLLSGSAATDFTDGRWTATVIASRESGVFAFHANGSIEAQNARESVTVAWGLAATASAGRVTGGIEFTGANSGSLRLLAGTRVGLARWLTIDMGAGGDPRDGMEIILTSGMLFSF